MPRAGLTRDRVVAEAAAVADQVGLDRLTLAAVAHRCGVSLPGLYKHIDSLDRVKRHIAVQAVRELTVDLAVAAVGLAGRDALHALAAAYSDYAAAHPGRYAASVRAPAPGDEEHQAVGAHAIGVLASALKAYDISGDDLIDAVRMTRAAFHGFASLRAAGGFGLPRDTGVAFGRLVDALDTAFRTWNTPLTENT